MHIIGFGCNQVPPVKYLHFDCDERVNLFVGPNASGKTTILRAIKGSYSESRENTPVSGGIEFTNSLGNNAYFYMEASDDWPRDPSIAYPYNSEAVIWDSVPLLYVPATRTNLPGQDVFGRGEYGLKHYDTDAPLKRLFETDSGIFDGSYVQIAIDWLVEDLTSDPRRRTQLRRAVEAGYSCARDICHEVIYDEGPHTFVELVEFDDDEEPTTQKFPHFGMGVVTSDDILGEPLYAGVLSSGTQGTLLWIWALALKIVNHYGWTPGWEEKPAILLIDEIENHLHPTWQRRVIPSLLKHFPGLQIFATTHSPFVVAGREAGQVHLLNRDENGTVTATTNTENVIGWTADEILRTLFEVEDPTDDRTAAAARELRQLRNGGPKDTENAEEQRQARMGELRKLVDRDLLAGGPWKKQRELFEQQFAETLKKYQQSQDLNQENG